MLLFRSCWSAVRSRVHALVGTQGSFSYSGLNRQMRSCSQAMKSQTVGFFAEEFSGEQKYQLFFFFKEAG